MQVEAASVVFKGRAADAVPAVELLVRRREVSV